MLKDFRYDGKRDTIKLQDINLPKSVSAKARDIFVKNDIQVKMNPMSNEYAYKIKSGSKITDVEIIAGRGMKRVIDDIKRLINSYPLDNGELTKVEDWQKLKGFAELIDIKTEKNLGRKEIHWYQGKNIGKVEFKTKERVRK